MENEYDSGSGSSYGPTHTLSQAILGTAATVNVLGTVITGTNTLFGDNLRLGDAISVGGVVRTIATIATNGAATVTFPFPSPQTNAVATVGYFLLPGSGVTCSENSTAVVGSGTNFANTFGVLTFPTNAQPRIFFAGESHFIASVADDTHLTFWKPHVQGTAGIAVAAGTGGLLQNEQWQAMNNVRSIQVGGLAQFPDDVSCTLGGVLSVVADTRNTYQNIRNGQVLNVNGTSNKVPTTAVIRSMAKPNTDNTGFGAASLQLESSEPPGPTAKFLVALNNYNKPFGDLERNSLDIYDYVNRESISRAPATLASATYRQR